VVRRPVELIEVHDSWSAGLLEANAWYESEDGVAVRALQLVWSDPAGHLPWEPGYTLAGHLQPLHGNPVGRTGGTGL